MAWSIEALKEHFERVLAEMDRRVEAAQRAANVAIEKAELAIDKRLALLNEFRAQAADQQGKYASKEEILRLLDRLSALESSRDRIYGAILLAMLLGVVNLVKVFWIE